MGKKALKRALEQDRQLEAVQRDVAFEYSDDGEMGERETDYIGDAVRAFCDYTSRYCAERGLPMCEEVAVEDVFDLVESMIVQTET